MFRFSPALDVGSGSGYLTVCFAQMVGPQGKVVGIDHIKELVDWSESNVKKNHRDLLGGRVKLVVGDGRQGYAADGPYHAIHVGAAAPHLPNAVSNLTQCGCLRNCLISRNFCAICFCCSLWSNWHLEEDLLCQ